MKSKGSSEDLNLIALAKLCELIDLDNELLPAWKTEVLRVLKNDVPEDIAPLENLIRGGANDPTKDS